MYIGFLFWSFVYYTVRALSAELLDTTPPSFSIRILFWDGSAHHLWFLPFIFLASVAGFLVERTTRHLRAGYWVVVWYLRVYGVITGFKFSG
ncbi:MAG: hypothetical protein LH606_05540 [Cytophagaceae bacterium]|nr:hypothetical protein [Cytophagaceae bacterium]